MTRRAFMTRDGARAWRFAWIARALPSPAAAAAAAVLICQSSNARSLAQSSPPADQPSPSADMAELPAVTIQGERMRQLRHRVDHFVTSAVFQPHDESLMRWNTPVCPLVQGLPRAFDDFVQSRILQIARAARAPVAGNDCAAGTANLYVFASDHPDRLLKRLWARNPRMYDTRNGLGAAGRFVHSQLPIRVWYNAESVCREATGRTANMEFRQAKSGGAGSTVDDTSSGICPGAGTRLSYANSNSIRSVFIVVDMTRVTKITTRQLADYAAMTGLADVRLNADAGPVPPTILRLFQQPTPARGLSAWDRALLYSLYNTSQSSVVQVSEMETAVMSRITHQPGADGPAPPSWTDEVLPRRDAGTLYWYRIGAEQGDRSAQYDLGVTDALGQGVPRDYTKAAQWFRKAAEQGHVDAQYNLGVMYSLGRGVPQDYAQADEWFLKAADGGNANAQSSLGAAYADGLGVQRNYDAAARWYQKAAEQGYIDAQVSLGALYANGRGVPQNYARAAVWYRMAAEQGNAAAEYDLGVMYLLGQGGPQDLAAAARWFGKAAQQGDVNAERSLGLAFAKGQGVSRDYAQAAGWFRKAADQRDADAQFYLGNMYDNGLGVARDRVTAYEWWALAKADSSSGDDTYARSQHKMTVSASRMTADQMASANREAADWLAAHRRPR